MYIVLSPAKSLDYETPSPSENLTQPVLMKQAAQLAEIARTLSEADLMRLMDISPALARLNRERFHAWRQKPAKKGARQAIFAFNGDVYEGLNAGSLDAGGLAYLQQHLRILSGLYGILRPFDHLQAYRLEMGTSLANPAGKNLYAFWGNTVTEVLNDLLAEEAQPVLVNLASDEYFKVVKTRHLKARLITPVFLDWKNGQYKVISFYAKRARGLMARYCAENRLSDAQDLRAFNLDGYRFNPEESDQQRWVFQRRLDGVA